MATVNTIAVDSTSNELFLTPLLPMVDDTVAGAVDYKRRPAVRSKHGRWRSASFIIVVEMAERIAYFGISSNLITFLTGKLGQSTAMAATNVNTWTGVSSLLPILGALIADSLLGQYYTILASSLLYILVLEREWHKPCVQAFGADQFDGEDPEESKAKSSFFNWWYFGVCVGGLIGIAVLSYVQDNLSWALGFGIPCIIMVVALVVFLCGTMTYRYTLKGDGESPFKRIGRVFVASARNWHASDCSVLDDKEGAQGMPPPNISRHLRFLDKALLPSVTSKGDEQACSTDEVEEAKSVLRLFPIWATSLVFAIAYSQLGTFFTKQGATLDRSIGPSFIVPAASLQCFASICIVVFLPIYDRVFVPIARALTGKPSGITTLERIAIGLFISIVCMIMAAVIEQKRLKAALEHGLIDLPSVTIPMSVWWLVPQYALFGLAESFTMVGLQEFFYDQVPNELRSVGLSLYLSVFGTGDLLSGLLVSLIDKATSRGGERVGFPIISIALIFITSTGLLLVSAS